MTNNYLLALTSSSCGGLREVTTTIADHLSLSGMGCCLVSACSSFSSVVDCSVGESVAAEGYMRIDLNINRLSFASLITMISQYCFTDMLDDQMRCLSIV